LPDGAAAVSPVVVAIAEAGKAAARSNSAVCMRGLGWPSVIHDDVVVDGSETLDLKAEQLGAGRIAQPDRKPDRRPNIDACSG
jgi:hypothetical protein